MNAGDRIGRRAAIGGYWYHQCRQYTRPASRFAMLVLAGPGLPGPAVGADAASSQTVGAQHAVHRSPGGSGWTGTWAASPQQARLAGLTRPSDPTVTGFGNQTVRETHGQVCTVGGTNAPMEKPPDRLGGRETGSGGDAGRNRGDS
jgi:hypothetical protein